MTAKSNQRSIRNLLFIWIAKVKWLKAAYCLFGQFYNFFVICIISEGLLRGSLPNPLKCCVIWNYSPALICESISNRYFSIETNVSHSWLVSCSAFPISGQNYVEKTKFYYPISVLNILFIIHFNTYYKFAHFIIICRAIFLWNSF